MDTEKTYTFKDLENIEFGGTPLAVVGHPIAHSISPAMHNAALAKLREVDRRFSDWNYFRFDIPPEQFAKSLDLFHKRGFSGLNLTIPHKVQVMNLIQEVSSDALSMGAVNTLVRNESGYAGLNTDGYGLLRGLELDLGVSPQAMPCMILGSGGAARAAAVQCLLAGCERLYVGNRSPDRLLDLMTTLEKLSGNIPVQAFPLNELPQDLPELGIVVNATALGLQTEDPPPIDAEKLASGWKVYDMIYNPPTTALLNCARHCNLPVANGLSMLVHQGARSLEIWSQNKVDVAAMKTAAYRALNIQNNHD